MRPRRDHQAPRRARHRRASKWRFTGAAFVLAGAVAAGAQTIPPLLPDLEHCSPIPALPPLYEWQGESVACGVELPSRRYDTTLRATLFTPADRSAYPGRRPTIVVLPGSGGSETSQHTKARALAGHGYVVLSVSPANNPEGGGTGSDSTNFVDAVQSGIDFLLSADNHEVDSVDPERIGAAGYSQGAIGVSWAQEVDERIRAIVAWDHLASTHNGDEGSPRCPGVVDAPPTVPRAPALGQASETECDYSTPETKKTSWEHWKAADLPVMVVVHAGASHSQFNGFRSDFHEIVHYYTRAWFDAFLLEDIAALDRLKAEAVLGRDRSELLSVVFRSALYFPGGDETPRYDCPDMLGCEPIE